MPGAVLQYATAWFMIFRSVSSSILTAVALTGVLAVAAHRGLALAWWSLLPSGVLVVATGLWLRSRFTAAGDFGWPNRITLLRVVLLLLLLAVLWVPVPVQLAWAASLTAAVAALLDAVDGAVARRLGQHSAFGARFDMEADGAFVLLLSLLVWHMNKVGVWVVLCGLLRPLLLLAMRVWPKLAAPLPPSARRKQVAALQMVVLPLALCPLVSPQLASVLCAVAVLSLLASFAIDIRWLVRT